jgi:hypothetical protein
MVQTSRFKLPVAPWSPIVRVAALFLLFLGVLVVACPPIASAAVRVRVERFKVTLTGSQTNVWRAQVQASSGDAGGGTRTPRHADYDSAVLFGVSPITTGVSGARNVSGAMRGARIVGAALCGRVPRERLGNRPGNPPERRPMSSQDRSETVPGPASNGHAGSNTLGHRLHRFLHPVPKLRPPINPALLKREHERAQARQNRVADAITTFSGSMLFVYLHLIWFGSWIAFGVEDYPFGLLTMIVSLEAIFLSTFVMISQNRADARRQVIADHAWTTVQEEDRQNVELLDISNQILALTKEVRALAGPEGKN